MSLLIYILIIWGLSNIVSNEYVFEWLRQSVSKFQFLRDLMNCTTCLGFWLGLILFLVLNPVQVTGIIIIDSVFGGLICSGINNILEHFKIHFGS